MEREMRVWAFVCIMPAGLEMAGLSSCVSLYACFPLPFPSSRGVLSSWSFRVRVCVCPLGLGFVVDLLSVCLSDIRYVLRFMRREGREE